MEGDDQADGEEGGADVRRYPVRLVFCCPAVDEEADGDDEAAGDHEGDAVFGDAVVVVVLSEALIYLIN